MTAGNPRPRVGISRCLLGDEVRYDGTHKRDEALITTFSHHVEWVSVCPEVEVGMGTPREPIQLVARDEGLPSGLRGVRLLGVTTGEDWTERMHTWARARVQELRALGLSGYVLKARSPSCGVRDVPVKWGRRSFSDDTRAENDLRPHFATAGRGLFAQALVEAMPDLPVEDEERLRDADARERFLRRVLDYASHTSQGSSHNNHL